MKQALQWIIGYDTEYTKREMALFTRIVLGLLIFIVFIFCVLFVAHMKFGLSYRMVKVFWQYYLTFARWLITAYSVSWIGQMGKAFLAKREEEKNKLKRDILQNTEDEEEEEDEEDIEEDE